MADQHGFGRGPNEQGGEEETRQSGQAGRNTKSGGVAKVSGPSKPCLRRWYAQAIPATVPHAASK